jgi:hypothetical protein
MTREKNIRPLPRDAYQVLTLSLISLVTRLKAYPKMLSKQLALSVLLALASATPLPAEAEAEAPGPRGIPFIGGLGGLGGLGSLAGEVIGNAAALGAQALGATTGAVLDNLRPRPRPNVVVVQGPPQPYQQGPPPGYPYQQGPPRGPYPVSGGPPPPGFGYQQGQPQRPPPQQPPRGPGPVQQGPPRGPGPVQQGPPRGPGPVQQGPPRGSYPPQQGPPRSGPPVIVQQGGPNIAQYCEGLNIPSYRLPK